MSASIQHTINCKGELLDLSRPIVMGILNTTPDSFFDGGKHNSTDGGLKHGLELINQGAKIIDIGGYSSRPGAEHISIDEEISRTIPVIKALLKEAPKSIISIDTFRSEVAKAAVEAGAAMVNDISAGDDDPEMLPTMAKLNVPYIIMHKKGTPKTMQHNPEYDDVVAEVFDYLAKKLQSCWSVGINDVIIDPGLGFGKTIEHNYSLLKQLHRFQLLDAPLLLGASRKSMLYKLLEIDSRESLNATTVANTIALQKGAKILRVHDPKEALECIRLVEFMNSVE